jgi:hypothetical protein
METGSKGNAIDECTHACGSGRVAPAGGDSALCTPGFWKQSQHFDSWTAPYDPTDLFSAYFEDAFPGETLRQVLSQ